MESPVVAMFTPAKCGTSASIVMGAVSSPKRDNGVSVAGCAAQSTVEIQDVPEAELVESEDDPVVEPEPQPDAHSKSSNAVRAAKSESKCRRMCCVMSVLSMSARRRITLRWVARRGAS